MRSLSDTGLTLHDAGEAGLVPHTTRPGSMQRPFSGASVISGTGQGLKIPHPLDMAAEYAPVGRILEAFKYDYASSDSVD
jgi:hypothetical protein